MCQALLGSFFLCLCGRPYCAVPGCDIPRGCSRSCVISLKSQSHHPARFLSLAFPLIPAAHLTRGPSVASARPPDCPVASSQTMGAAIIRWRSRDSVLDRASPSCSASSRPRRRRPSVFMVRIFSAGRPAACAQAFSCFLCSGASGHSCHRDAMSSVRAGCQLLPAERTGPAATGSNNFRRGDAAGSLSIMPCV